MCINSDMLFKNRGRKIFNIFIATTFIFCRFTATLNGQYFNGPNKPGYKVFEYRVLTTPHFEVYHYFNNDSTARKLSESAEKWYGRHLQLFKDTFKTRNPIIIYSNHADFQQTNAIMGNIGIGTGGVTEALKNRVVLPVMESDAQTDHVLGHELVHAFQYRLILGEDSMQQRNLRNIPLWMIEGMAEYMSIGSFDPNTAMWMRDAIVNNDFPSLDDLTRSYKYFPYRYGQAFWAYIAGLYGDTIVKPLFDLTTKIGYDRALDSLTHYNEKTFSEAWKKGTKDFYFSCLKDTIERPVGTKILFAKNSGTINIAPSLSPDGKYVAFVSEKDLFTFDLFLADAYSGKIIRMLSSTVRDNKIDDFNYLESGGTWSPDGKNFAFVTFSKGKNRLLIINVEKPSEYEEIDVPGVDAFNNPSWSPDGNTIVLCGLSECVTDLYSFNMKSKKVENLTHDIYCNLQPAWSADGKYLAFATDRPSYMKNDTSKRGYRIGILDIQTQKISTLPVFPGSENLNPQFSPDGKFVYFVSDADGFRNLYRYSLDSGKVYRLTRLITGISGVTEFTPAFSIDRTSGNIVYTHYYKADYNLYQATEKSFKAQLLPADRVDFTAAHLPPFKRSTKNIVDYNIDYNINQNIIPNDSFKTVPYKSKFQLDYVGGTSMGVGVSSYYGTGMAGSVDMLFSDMVGNYQLYSGLALNGEIYDFAGSVAFINNKNIIDWGVSLSHIPLRYGYYSEAIDSSVKVGKYTSHDRISLNYQRIFEDAITIFAIKPLSQTKRLEAYTSFSYYSQRLDRYNYYYDKDGNFLAQNIERNLPAGKGFGINNIGAAYTMDNAYMGIASPLRGQRFRAETEYYYGDMNFVNFLIDYRKYVFFNPFCIAMRLYHMGRYGNESTNDVYRALFIGWPWLVRGYDNSYLYSIPTQNSTDKINLLFGSKIAVANLELRVPFTGPERLCLIPFKYFVSELSFFCDAGLAWNSNSRFSFTEKAYINPVDNQPDYSKYRYPLVSYGISLRINFFGYMILEPFYAVPIEEGGIKNAGFGLNFLPGW
jgi:Tol biopolymer transport system component